MTPYAEFHESQWRRGHDKGWRDCGVCKDLGKPLPTIQTVRDMLNLGIDSMSPSYVEGYTLAVVKFQQVENKACP